MTDRFRTRQLVQLALTANALRPVPAAPLGVPEFFAGWVATELAPQLMGLTALDAAVHMARGGRRSALGLSAAGINLAAYAALIAGGRRATAELEDALVAALGP